MEELENKQQIKRGSSEEALKKVQRLLEQTQAISTAFSENPVLDKRPGKAGGDAAVMRFLARNREALTRLSRD